MACSYQIMQRRELFVPSLPLVVDLLRSGRSSLTPHIHVFFRLQIFCFKQQKMLASSMTVCVVFPTRHCHWPQLSAQKSRFQCLYGGRKQKTTVKPSSRDEFVFTCWLVCEITIFLRFFSNIHPSFSLRLPLQRK